MLNNQELNQLEKDRQNDSDWILKRIDLLSKLQKYGDVKIAGAKALGVMLAKDIDISVIVPKAKLEDWQSLTTELMITPHVRNISAIDYYNYDDQNRYNPKNGQKYSLYISINNMLGPEEDKNDTWECQIHLIEPEMFDEAKVTSVIQKITSEKRLLILKLKYWANEVNKILKSTTGGHFKIHSPFIYEAVLDNDIETTDSFIEFFKKHIPEKFTSSFSSAIEQLSN